MNERITAKGFTLIEILIVLVITAIIMAVAAMTLGHMGKGRRERMTVEAFMNVVTVAEQQAILTPSVLGLAFYAEGYQFFQYEAGAWKPLHDDVLSNQTAFKNLLTANLTFVSGHDEDIKSHAAKPVIIFSPSGFVTPFVLNLQGENHIYMITVQNNGTSTMTEKAIRHD